jgi:hypothetical protein
MEMDNNIVEPESETPVTEEPTSQAVETSNPTESDDAVLDRLLGGEPAKEETPAAEPETPQVDSEAVEKAVSVLKRDGVPDSVIAQMKESDMQGLTEWADSAAKRQAEVDKFGNRLKALEEGNKEKEAESQPDTSAEDPFLSVEAKYGEDAAKPLREMAEQMQAQLAQVQHMAISSELSRAENNMQAVWSDKELDRDKITTSMQALAEQHPGRFKSVEEMMFVACCDIYGEPDLDSLDEKKLQKPTKAQPTPIRTSAPTPSPKKELTPAQKEDAILDAIMGGKSASEAKAMFS